MSTPQIDRKTASRLLNITLRTVDRYIASGKLQADRTQGRIWLDKKEVLSLKAKRRRFLGYQRIIIPHEPVGMSIENVYSMSTPSQVQKSPKGASDRQNQDDNYTGNNNKNPPGETPADIYKNLFKELQLELKNKQERLEGANYRVGQLEALVKDSVPRLDHIKALNESKQQARLQFENLNQRLKTEKTDKKIYLFLLFIILLLQPLWLILSLR